VELIETPTFTRQISALWGRLATCAAVANRRCLSADSSSGPITNRPQLPKLPHKYVRIAGTGSSEFGDEAQNV